MNRIIVGLTLAAVLLVGVSPTMAADRYWNYTNRAAYPAQPYCPAPPAKQERPLLQKLLIGGALIGIGFAAGRLTAPQPEPYYTGYNSPHYPPVYDPAFNQCRRY